MREKGGLGYRPLPRMIDHVPFWYRKRCSSGFYRGKKSIRMTTHARFRYRRPKTDDLKVSVNFSTERDIIFSASPLASAFCFFNKLVASVVVLVAVALGNGCGGDGQYPYQEQQGGGAEYDFEPLIEYLPEVPLEEEEIHRKNEEICKKFPRQDDYDPERHFYRRRVSAVENGKVQIQDNCLLGITPPYENWLLENLFLELFAKVGVDWKEYPYRVGSITRYTGPMVSTQFVIYTKYMKIEVLAGQTKSCMESYPEYSQVVFQNGECNGQNSTRNYVPDNDKNIISKTDIDDVHKKNKDICNKISGHNYTRGETEIIDDDNVTFMDGCDVKISKKIWTENVIPELFNRKGLNWTEIPYKIDFILGNPAGGEFGATFMIIKTKNMNVNVTLEKTRSCILRKTSVDSIIDILPSPQTSYYGTCYIRQR